MSSTASTTAPNTVRGGDDPIDDDDDLDAVEAAYGKAKIAPAPNAAAASSSDGAAQIPEAKVDIYARSSSPPLTNSTFRALNALYAERCSRTLLLRTITLIKVDTPNLRNRLKRYVFLSASIEIPPHLATDQSTDRRRKEGQT